MRHCASGASGTPRVLPCAAGGVVGWSRLKMASGIFVRAVSTVGGSLIAGNDLIFDCGYRDQIV